MAADQVRAELMGLELPAALKYMLVDGLQPALERATCEEERHEFQTKVLELTEKVLTDGKASAVEAHQAAQAEIAEAEGVLAKSEEVTAELKKEEEAAQAALEEKSAKLDELKKATKEEAHQYKEAKALEAKASEDLQEFADEKEEIVKLCQGPLATLSEGTWEDQKQCNKAFEAVEAFFQSEEAALQVAMSKALVKKPAERGRFDVFTLEAVTGLLKGKVEELEPKIKEHTEARVPVNAEMLGARAIYEVAQEDESKAKDEEQFAKLALRTSSGKRKAAEADLKEKEGDLSAKKAKAELCEATTSNLSFAIENFQKLQAGPEKEPEPVPEPVPEAVPEPKVDEAEKPAEEEEAKVAETDAPMPAAD